MNLALAEQNTSLQVGEGLNSLENGSTPADKPYSIRIIPAIPEPPSNEARNRRWSTPAAFLSLLATILSISRIFGCLLELGYSPAVGMGIHGRMLSLADSSAFRRCMEGGSSRAATPISPLPPVSPVPGVSSFRLLPRGQTNHSDLDNEDILAKQTVKAEEQHVTMKQSVAQGVQQVKQTVERGGQHATSKKAVKGGDERPARNEKPDLFYLIDPLAPIAEEAELRRLKEALLLPASDAVNLTKEDMKVLKKASEKLTWMMKKRSQLAVALRKKLEERERLTAHMVRMSLNREPLRRGFGCLKRFGCLIILRGLKGIIDLVNSDIDKLETKLKHIRSQMKVFLRHKQQRAISLRLVAQRRIRGETLTAREADALSIAKLVTKGFRRTNYVPTPAEAESIVQMGLELSAALQEAVLRISNSLREASADSGCGGCSTCTSLRNHLAGCTVLQREAAMYALQLRSVIMTFPPEEFKEVIKNVEGGALQLRKKSELAAKFLENHSRRCD